MTDEDIVTRFKRQFPCCGELDSSGTCCAPACTFGEVMNALGKLKYIRAQSESALRGEQDPLSVLRVIKMNCDHALAARTRASEEDGTSLQNLQRTYALPQPPEVK
ncbi:MAG: hypothetical protein VX529_08175 [Pseudomonadota bacterium]|nr:hypothetical protein [Pseudomonadota bacterium]